MSAPLDGLRIIDLTRLLPGPAATMHLADFGADVIKVEDPGDGDYLRAFPPTVMVDGHAVNPAYDALNRGKRSIRIDLKSPAGRDLLLQMAARADAVVESFRPGVLDRLGLGWDALHAANPKLVLCSISGYGQHGPLAAKAGHDLNYIALAGVLDQTRVGGRPAVPNLQLGDTLGGTLSALSTLLVALLGAQRSGIGRHVDVAMTDGLLAHHFFPHAELDAGAAPRAGDTLLTGGVPCYQVYECADGRHLAVAALEWKFWRAFCDAVGLPDLKTRHWSLGDSAGSTAAQADTARVAAHLRTQPLAHWTALLDPVDCCTTPVLTPAEALAQPQFAARVVRRQGAVTRIGPLAQMDDGGRADRPAAQPGAHTRELLRELGHPDARIDGWLAQGIVRESA
jgi:crotonobetainyl-CoA:carnitine CoA-transferase CaiB-like acyl-CoA transferase